jgi:tetratricopeptide (TPR) repeat protein
MLIFPMGNFDRATRDFNHGPAARSQTPASPRRKISVAVAAQGASTMIDRRMAFLIGGAAVVALAVASTFAVMRLNAYRACDAYSMPPSDAEIARCTGIIQSDRTTPRDRAKAFAGRGQLHALARKLEQAVEDYDQAVRLNPNDAQLFVKRGHIFLQKGDWDRAVQDFADAIRLEPDNPTTFHHRALGYERKGDYDRAIQDYDQAIRLNPRDIFAQAALHIVRGAAYATKGDYDQAILNFEQGLRLGRDNRLFALRLDTYEIPTFQLSSDGRVVKFSGEVTFGAAKELARLLAANTSITVIHLQSPGGFYYQQIEMAQVIKRRGLDTYVSERCHSACANLFLAGRKRLIGPAARIGFHEGSRPGGAPSIDASAMLKAELLKSGLSEHFARRALQPKLWYPLPTELLAERIATRVVDASEFPPPVYPLQSQLKAVDLLYAFGQRHFEEGRLDRAIVQYDQVIRRDPDHLLALARRGDAYSDMGKLDRAIHDYDQVNRLDPQSAVVLFNRGAARLERGDYDAALQDFYKAVELSPDYPEIYYYCGLAHDEKAAYDRAIECYSAAISRAPDYRSALAARGGAYLAKEDYDRAIQDFDRWLLLEPTNAVVWNARCWARALVGRLESAIADCNESLRLHAGVARTFHSRGFAYFKMGEFDKAIADYDAALKRVPDLASSLYGRGLARLQKGDRDGGNADIAAGKAIRPTLDEEFAKYGLRAP